MIEGNVEPGYESVAGAFDALFRDVPQLGAALAVRHRGRMVVDLWGGQADTRTGRPWQRDTAAVVFSCTKGITALLACRLVQDGLLDPDAPVARYWPEFAVFGKDRLLVRDMLSHRAGLVVPDPPLTRDEMLNARAAADHLAAQRPRTRPGTAWEYHAITHGWLAAELIRRVAGADIQRYLRDMLTGPLQADFWIGLPEGSDVDVAWLTTAPSGIAAARSGVPTGRDGLTLSGLLPLDLVGEGGEGFNDPAIQHAVIPGAGGIGTARALAAIWSSAVTHTDGVRVVSDATLDRVLAAGSDVPPAVETAPPWPRWTMGLLRQTEGRPLLSDTSFGHDGYGGQVAFADRRYATGFAFITNLVEGNGDRANAMINAVRNVVIP